MPDRRVTRNTGVAIRAGADMSSILGIRRCRATEVTRPGAVRPFVAILNGI
jgi:hypothetical protein